MSSTARGHLLVVAKEPIPGRVKTRLSPPFTSGQAAEIAEASLTDTLAAVAQARASRRVVALDGRPGPWLPGGVEVVPQAGGGLADRLEAAWTHAGAPGLQIGMDTPQVSAELLEESLAPVTVTADGAPRADAVLGLAEDGGWWAIGFRDPAPGAFAGVPMSTPDTGARQLDRLRALGLRVHLLPTLRDLDTAADAEAVAASAPATRTAGVLRRLEAVRAVAR